MTEVDTVDPFEIHETTDETTDETFPLTPASMNHTIDHIGVDETSFVTPSLSQGHKVLNQMVHSLYEKLSHGSFERETEIVHSDLFDITENELYYTDINDPNGRKPKEPLTKNGTLKTIPQLEKILGVKRLEKMGFNVRKKITTDELNSLKEKVTDVIRKIHERFSLGSELSKADDIELEEIQLIQ